MSILDQKNTSKNLIRCLLIAMLPGLASAELYCVTTSAQLVSAVADANASTGASEIRVAVGSYQVTASGAAYALRINGQGDLLLTGGWAGPSCQTLSTFNPELTTIGTSNTGKLMAVDYPSQRVASIEISGIGFRSAVSNDQEPACLLVDAPFSFAERNTLILDRNSFRLCSNTLNSNVPSTLEVDAKYLDAYIRNNVFADNAGLTSVARLLARTTTTMYVSNNTIAYNPSLFGSAARAGLSIAGADNTNFFWVTNNVVSNNGSANNTGDDFAETTGFTLGVVSSNLFRRIGATTTMTFIDNQQSDPLLASSTDLRVTAASPLRNSGNSAPAGGALSLDSLGMPRVQGGRIDRGAFEFDEFFANGFE